MARSQLKSKKSVQGSRYVALRKKRLCELAGLVTETTIGKLRVKVKRVQGGNLKTSLLSHEEVCINDGKGKVSKLKIVGVEENPANVNYTKRNIITKGAIVKTDKGNVKITSRPGQSGVLFGTLL